MQILPINNIQNSICLINAEVISILEKFFNWHSKTEENISEEVLSVITQV